MSIMRLLLVLFFCWNYTESQVMLSPSGEVSVCPGGQLSFRCSTNLRFLEWNITVNIQSRRIPVTSLSQFASPFVINGHSFNVTRNSADELYSLISTVTVSNVLADLNGTRVNCTEIQSSPHVDSSTSVATINVLTPQLIYPDAPEVDTPLALEFGAYNIVIMIQWTSENTSSLSYTVDTVPDANITEREADSVQLQVLYNTVYNVSVISTLCGVNSAVTSVMLNFVMCIHPLQLMMIDDNLRATLDRDLILVRNNASFSCLNGHTLIGPKESTCTEGGHWEPDPREIECKVNCGTPPEPSNGIIIPYTGTTEGAEVFFICRSVYHKGSLLEDNYTVSICNKNGQWEPNPGNFCATMSETSAPNQVEVESVNIVTVAVSTSAVLAFIVSSTFVFVIGFLCGCFYQSNKNEDSNKNKTPTVVYEEIESSLRPTLELNQNVAYEAHNKASNS